MAPNRVVLLTAPPNKGKSSTALQILARSAPFHKIFVLHGTPGTKEYDCVDHEVLHTCPSPQFWKDQAKEAKGKPCAIVIDDYGISDGVSKEEKKNIEMLVRTVASHLGYLVLITAHSHTNVPAKWRRSQAMSKPCDPTTANMSFSRRCCFVGYLLVHDRPMNQ